MSRSGYSDDIEMWDLIRYRGAVKSAIRGFRGQCFLQEMRAALDALPARRLISDTLQDAYDDGAVCALGALGKRRGINMEGLDPHCPESVAHVFGIAEALAREIVYENDDGVYRRESPEERFSRMRAWVEGCIRKVEPA